jgi:hypothetical protein
MATIRRRGAADPAGLRSLLFVRAVPAALALPALRWLREHAPATTITALTSAGGRAPLEEAGVIDACEIYEGRRLGIAAAGLRRLIELGRRRFDVVVVPYVGDRRDYWNVARLALAIRGRVTLWIKCDGLPSGGDPQLVLDRVVLADWWRETRTPARLRLLLLRALKWPALVAAYALGMVFLAVLAVILMPLVWLKPEPEGRT